MKTIKEAAINLLKVKSIVTILTTCTFVYLAVTGQISQDFMVVYSVIIAFYFGTQAQKKADAQEKEEGENLSFRNRSFLNRLSRMLEDRITLTRTLGGFEVEGLRKDTIRIIYGLENALRKTE